MTVLKNWRFWLGVAISLLLIGAVLYNTNPAELAAALASANYWWLVPAVAVYFVGVWLRAWRWRYLLRPVKVLPVGLLFRTIVIGYTANDILPFRLGEVVRAVVLGERGGVSKAATLTTIVVERIMDGLTMVGFMVVASLFLPLDDVLQNTVRLSAVLMGGVVVVLYIVVISRRAADALLALVLRPLPSALAGKSRRAGRTPSSTGSARCAARVTSSACWSSPSWAGCRRPPCTRSSARASAWASPSPPTCSPRPRATWAPWCRRPRLRGRLRCTRQVRPRALRRARQPGRQLHPGRSTPRCWSP